MNEERPLSVVIGLIVKDNKVLLLKRIKEPFKGFYGFPGGKIERGEHVEEAVIREIKEETGIDAQFVKIKAIVSEHVYEESALKHHFMLYFCICKALTEFLPEQAESETVWLDYTRPIQIEKVIPSDRALIEEILVKNKEGYFTSKLNNHENSIEIKQIQGFTS